MKKVVITCLIIIFLLTVIIFYEMLLGPKKVALTFDDGPSPFQTAQVLNILKEQNVKATFFMLGKRVEKHPKIVQRIKDEKHGIGNHSYRHISFHESKSTESLLAEIILAEVAIEKVAGFRPRMIRPPFGDISKSQWEYLEKKGYEIVMWNVFTFDWKKNVSAEDILNKIKTYKPNSVENIKRRIKLAIKIAIKNKFRRPIFRSQIVLLHDYPPIQNTIKALPEIIKYYKDNKYEFVTVNQLLGISESL